MKTNDAEYQANHKRVRMTRGQPWDFICVTRGCDKDGRDWAHIHDTDPTDPKNFRPMCRKCHKAYDRPEWLQEERRLKRKHIERTGAFAGWTPERRETQRQRMLSKWSDPKEREAQAERALRDQPWLDRRPSKGGGSR
jgi:hypothetical protein